MKHLKVSDDLSLPLDFVTERIAFLARTGAGKLRVSRFWIPATKPAVASVIGLLFRRGPSDIHRPVLFDALFAFAARVIAVVVFAVNRMVFGRPAANVFAEDRRRIDPPLADHYSSFAPFRVVGIVSVIATGLESFPCMILSGLTQAVGAIRRSRPASKASAGCGWRAQVILSNGSLFSAFATAKPCSMLMIGAWGLSENNKHPKDLSSNIRRSPHAQYFNTKRGIYGE